MEKFLMGMVFMYFILNTIAAILIIYTQWKYRKSWKMYRLFMMFLIGTPLLFLETFHDEF